MESLFVILLFLLGFTIVLIVVLFAVFGSDAPTRVGEWTLESGCLQFIFRVFGREIFIGLFFGLATLCILTLVGTDRLFQTHVMGPRKVPPTPYRRTKSLTCQRLEPSLPVTCEQEYFPCRSCREAQTRNFELQGATVQKPRGEQGFWTQLQTDKYDINLAECNNVAECNEVSDAINYFVEDPEEDASYVLGESKLTIEDGRLTYEYEP